MAEILSLQEAANEARCGSELDALFQCWGDEAPSSDPRPCKPEHDALTRCLDAANPDNVCVQVRARNRSCPATLATLDVDGDPCYGLYECMSECWLAFDCDALVLYEGEARSSENPLRICFNGCVDTFTPHERSP